MCFAPQGRALFRHLICQKCSDPGVFCTFWLGNVLRATTACRFSTTCKSAPTVMCFVHFDLEMCFAPQWRALSTSQLPKVVRAWCVLCILTWKRVSCHKGVQFFISHLATWLRTRHFSEPNFSTLRSHKSSAKHSVSRLCYLFAHLDLLSSETFSSSFFFLPSSFFFSSLLFSDSSHLCFSSVHTVRSLTSKLPSIRHNRKTNNSQKRRSWGAGFCTWMFQYIWVVILISNAFLFNGNDWFKAFVWPLCPWPASPYHLLHSFMQPIMPTTILVLGHIEKSKQILEN